MPAVLLDARGLVSALAVAAFVAFFAMCGNS
jgi:hypothetical protein